MGLRELAEQDLGAILSDSAHGFGWRLHLENPAGLKKPLTGFSNDISQAIDPETGQIISGRFASIALRTRALYRAGFEIPTGVVDPTARPWVVRFEDINGRPGVFKIKQTHPDGGLGLITCDLEEYDA